MNARERVHELTERFRAVIIENRDDSRIFDSNDDTDIDAFFYADPPSVDHEHYCGVEFVEVLETVASDWMVSDGDLPDGLDDYTIFSRDRQQRMVRGDFLATERLV